MNFKLITYNVWHGTHLEKVIEFLQKEQADVICLQEVGTSGVGMAASKRNIWTEIQKALDMKGEYRRMLWADVGGGRYDLGVGILTRLPMSDSVTFAYEREYTDSILAASSTDRYSIPRKLLGVQIDFGREKLWVFNTHHTITPDGGVTEHQLRQTEKLKNFLKTYDEYVLCGDMNTPRGNENYQRLSEGLKDISGKAPSLHPTIHPVGNLGYHVDYVFLKGDRLRAVETWIPVVDGSDHLLVIVELST